MQELSDHCIDHVFKGLELADESVVIHLIVGLESNECRVYLYAGFIRFSLDLQCLDGNIAVFTIAQDMVQSLLVLIIDYAAERLDENTVMRDETVFYDWTRELAALSVK